jgi:hypothetical protein
MSPGTLATLWLLATLAPLLFAIVFLARQVRQIHKYNWRDVLQVAMRAPSWWHAWWPRVWLSPLERSHELPLVARRACRSYVAFSTAIVLTLALLGAALNLQLSFTEAEWPRVEQSTAWIAFSFIAHVCAPIAVALFFIVFAWSWWSARKVIGNISDPRARHLFERLRSAGTWREPWVSDLIRDASGARSKAPKNFRELVLDALALENRLVNRGALPDHDLSGILERSRDSYGQWELEAKALAADANTSEPQHLRARLRAIDDMVSPREDQIAERDLVQRQVSLHEDRLSRMRDLDERRERLHTTVERLWRKLRSLGVGDGVQGVATTSSEVLAIAAEIESALETTVDTVRLEATTKPGVSKES